MITMVSYENFCTSDHGELLIVFYKKNTVVVRVYLRKRRTLKEVRLQEE